MPMVRSTSDRVAEPSRVAYHAEMQQVLESLGLECPDMNRSLDRGLEKFGRKAVPAGAEKVQQ